MKFWRHAVNFAIKIAKLKRKLSDALGKQSRKNEFISFECTTKRLKVQKKVNREVCSMPTLSCRLRN